MINYCRKSGICLLTTLFLWGGCTFGQINPIQIGRSGNSYTTRLLAQNQVFVVDSLNLVAFIHRQDPGIWGGGIADNGIFRIAIQLDELASGLYLLRLTNEKGLAVKRMEILR